MKCRVFPTSVYKKVNKVLIKNSFDQKLILIVPVSTLYTVDILNCFPHIYHSSNKDIPYKSKCINIYTRLTGPSISIVNIFPL